jgi:PKHD-type hydroxylase
MNGEWCYFKSYFTKEECEKILADGLKLPPEESTVGTDNGVQTNLDVRKSKVRFIQRDDSNFEWLFDKIWKIGLQANSDWFNFHVTKLSFIQLAEYHSKNQGEYKRHHDVFWINNDPYYHRKLTCVIQLTNPLEYDGGNFEIWSEKDKPNAHDIRQQGSAIFIPSFVEHHATPVTRGKRYSLAVWFEGPKWR